MSASAAIVGMSVGWATIDRMDAVPRPEDLGHFLGGEVHESWGARAVAALEVPHAPWVEAGQFSVLLSGHIAVPDLPASPGLIRMDRVILSGAKEVVVNITEHDSMRADDPTWNEPELAAGLLAGERTYVYFLDADDWPYESPDMHEAKDRKALIGYIEQRAEDSGYWVLETVGVEHVLVLDP